MSVLYRFRYSRNGGHVHVRMFAGKGVGSLGKCGALVFRDHEWDHFRAGIERTIGTDRGIGHDVEFIDETPSDAPFLAVGNDELGAPVGEMGDCPHCRGRHLIEYGEKVLPDGTREPSRLLGFVRCDDGNAYVCAINGRALGAAP